MASSTSTRLEWIGSAIDLYQGRLIRFAARITGDVESARDVVQDTFLRLCREDVEHVRDTFRHGCSASAGTARSNVRKKEGPLQTLDDALTPAREDRRPIHTRSSKRVMTRGACWPRSAPCPRRKQEVLRLRFQEELSYKEISGVTGHTAGASAS